MTRLDFWNKIPQRRSALLVASHQGVHDIRITSVMNYEHLIKVVLARFLLCKVTIFPFPYCWAGQKVHSGFSCYGGNEWTFWPTQYILWKQVTKSNPYSKLRGVKLYLLEGCIYIYYLEFLYKEDLSLHLFNQSLFYISMYSCIFIYLKKVFLKIFFFLMWTIFKVFTELVKILLLFYVLVFLATRHVGS